MALRAPISSSELFGRAVGRFWTDAEYGHEPEGEIGIVRGVGRANVAWGGLRGSRVGTVGVWMVEGNWVRWMWCSRSRRDTCRNRVEQDLPQVVWVAGNFCDSFC